jgi:hypothetical protein
VLRLTRTAPALALAATLAAAGCASSPGPDEGDDRGGAGEPASEPASAGRPVSGDEYLDAGDYEKAVLEFDRLAAASPDDPAVREKLRTARRLAAQERATRAAQAAEKNDWARAAFELKKAEAYDRDALPVKRLRESLGSKFDAAKEIDESKGRAKELLATDPPAAVAALTDLRRRAPYDPEIVELLTDATRRVEADRAAGRAAEAWDAGVRRRAIEHLAAATIAGQPVPAAAALRRRMETDLAADAAAGGLTEQRDAWMLAVDAKLSPATVDFLRDRLGESLVREARTHEAAGRPATAALFELEAQRAGARVETRNLDRVRGTRAIRVHVAPFDDSTGGSVDGLRLARALRDRLAIDASGGSSALVATVDAAPAGATYPDLAVRGVATSHRVTSGRIGRETQRVRYVSGMRNATSPAAVQLGADLTAARSRLERASDQVAVAETNLRHLRNLGYGRGAGGTVPTEGDAALQTQIAGAEASLENARRVADRALREEFDIRQRILATPATVAEPVWDDVAIEVTTLFKTAEVVVHLRVLDGDRVLLDEPVSASEVHRETVAPAVPSAGIAADPDDTPDDAAMAVLASAKFADNAAGRVRHAVEGAARRLLEEARAAERGGDPAAAAETYAVFLLSTPENATPERAAAARAIFEILGAAPALRTGFRPESRR